LSSYLDQETSTNVFGYRVKLPPVTTSLTTRYYISLKVEAIPLSALPKDTTSELAAYLHTNPFNRQAQGSCEYQLLNSYGLTWPGNRTQIYRL